MSQIKLSISGSSVGINVHLHAFMGKKAHPTSSSTHYLELEAIEHSTNLS